MRKGEVDRSNDIGLTQAFAPIGDDGWSEGAGPPNPARRAC